MNSGSIQAGGVREGSHSVGRCESSEKSRNAAEVAGPEIRAAKSSDFREGE